MQKILIIENDTDLLDLVDYILIGCGYKALTSEKKLSIDEIIDLKPSLVIIDHLIDGRKGGDLCLELKANELSKHIPVILMSVDNELYIVEGKSCADAYIEKPFDINYFEKKVEELAL